LDLRYNSVGPALPDAFTALTALTSLDLRANRLEALPPRLGRLTNLQVGRAGSWAAGVGERGSGWVGWGQAVGRGYARELEVWCIDGQKGGRGHDCEVTAGGGGGGWLAPGCADMHLLHAASAP
jgi:hypothetical protein